ncbi:MAG TPA: DnaB-like helicase C-terminal domain-containing protein [Gemmatimonadaceae bacterium]|nr:DnaB-like helicase C-terminal domain-containing protein [Gemmatimonadaceae bacterium]
MKPTPPFVPASPSSSPAARAVRPTPAPLERILARLDAAAAAESRPLRLDSGGAADAPPNDAVVTGFPSVDRLLGGGLRAGDLVVVGGDVGSGKSALALALALRAASVGADDDGPEQAGNVVYFSGEMTVDRVVERALALEGRARVDDLRRGALGDEAARGAVGAAALRLRDAALDLATLPAGGADALAEALRRTLDLRMAVVDPIEALAVGGRARDEELAAATARLKALALEVGAPIVVTAQLPRLERGRSDLRPRLDDFGALGALAQHADVVLALFREEMYDPGAPGVEGATELLVLKNRNGPTGYVDLYFYKQWMRFEDMVEE